MLRVQAGKGLACLLILLPVGWALELPRRLGAPLLSEQLLALELGLAIAFVLLRAKKRSAFSLLEDGLGLIGLALGLWLAWRFKAIAVNPYGAGAEPALLGGALALLTLWAAWRSSGLALVSLLLLFLCYGLLAPYLPAPFGAPSGSLETYFSYLAFGSDALLGSALEIITTTVLLFVLFAKCFELCGGADFVSRLAFSASARSRGGPIKAAVIASGLFGSISGSTTSNVLSSGSFTIPMMRRMGVPPATAGGIEAVASTGGQIMPPVMGTAAFLMSDIAGLSYLSVITAALLPALLYYLSLMLEADRVGLSLSSPESATREPLPVILRGALGPLLPVAAIVITLFRFDYAPHWAALSGIAAALLVALWRERSPAKLCKAIFAKTVEMAPNAVQLVIVGAAIGVMLAAINKTGVAVQASIAISDLSESSLLSALLAVGLAAYVLGLGLSTTAVYVLVGTLLAPSLVALGVPVIAAHLFVFYMAMLSMISPPIAFACLVAASLSGATFLATCRAALRFSWLLIPLPFAFVYSPELLLEGRLWQSLASFAAACIGVLACANALSGRDGRRLDAWERAAQLLAGALLLSPLLAPHWRLAAGLFVLMILRRRWIVGRFTKKMESLPE